MKKRDEKTFDKKIQKEMDPAEKNLKKLKSRKFVCVSNAENEVKVWACAHPHHRLNNMQNSPIMEKVEKKRGRPKKDEPTIMRFKIECEIELNEDISAEERKRLGRFILASNKTDPEPEVMLNYYKGQQTVERGSRFLKDKSFHVYEVYLKKEERIEAFCMIIVLCLLIYSFAEWWLREELKEIGHPVPNQFNKPTQRPTMRWVFEIFTRMIQSVVTDIGKIIKSSCI